MVDTEPTGPYFTKSLGAHVALFALSLLVGRILAMTGLMPSLLGEKVTIVESVVRVDLVAMPKMTLQELKALDMATVKAGPENVTPEEAPKEKETAEVDAKDPEQPTLNEGPKKKALSDMLKELGKKKVSTKGRPEKDQSKIDSSLKGKFAQLAAEGNKLSKGGSLTGATAGEAGPFRVYISTLPDVVRPFWKLPSYLLGQGLTCRIRLYLSASGDLKSATIFQSSGNSEYDQKALEAVRRSAPFPAPDDDEVVARAVKGEIVLGFPL